MKRILKEVLKLLIIDDFFKVVNKLYLLSYASVRIEEFATNKLLSVVRDHTQEMEVGQTSFRDVKLEVKLIDNSNLQSYTEGYN
jgi:hypothetical protein